MWLSSVETIFNYMRCPEEHRVQCAAFLLRDRGIIWWRTTMRMLGGDVRQITWDQFKNCFYTKFFSANLRDAKSQEFLELKQGYMTVEEYDQEFDMLSRFAPELVSNEQARADRMKTAKELDKGSSSGQKRKVEQRTVGVPQRNLRPGDPFRSFQQSSGGAGDTTRERPVSLEIYWAGSSSQGERPPQRGTIFATNRSEAEKAGTVVTGTLPVLGHFALTLFDSGSSHSFISSLFVTHACLEVEPLDYVLSVSTPSGEIMLSKEKIKACEIEIAGRVLDVTLLVLDMRDFDVILGMDWLATNHASIDCSRKEVVFSPPTASSFKFKGVGTVVLPKVISAMKASKLLNQVLGVFWQVWWILGKVRLL
ncbi:uncharacterized protein LOC116405099 [Cucumis sativus]|uniref:uncharacterized protein LOC116405099 n=1 Tax=Cucumis sativus TaxID=3659 RepID=UPI0012F508EB|nr:uncharacterized protein LOC116405099 [Cucumis sativus]